MKPHAARRAQPIVRCARTSFVIGVIGAIVVAAGGCYERTVSAKGIGAMGTNVQDGYRSDTAMDRAWDSMFADPRSAKPVPKNPGVGSVR